MDEQRDRISFEDAISQGESYVSEGMTPETAAEKVLSEWFVRDEAVHRLASTGLAYTLKGERSEIPA